MADLGLLFDPALHQALSNYDLALDLARRGVSVFPCRPEPDEGVSKRPYPGVRWRMQSTTNALRIRDWWDRWPDAVPGIDLAKTDYLVIDLDGAVGHADWDHVRSGRACHAPRVSTPSGGTHLWFRREGRQHGNGRGDLPPKRPDLEHAGIDVRGYGGYVIAPGATMLNGDRYEPEEGDFLSAMAAPEWLWDILTRAEPELHAAPSQQPAQRAEPSSLERDEAYGHAAMQAECTRVASCGKGGRNETLNRAAFALGTLVGGGVLAEANVRAALTEAAQACGLVRDDGIRACSATIASGLRAGIAKPRGVPESGRYEVDSTLGAEAVAALLARKVVEASDGTLADAETGEVIDPPAVDVGEMPRELERPPGLVGELAEFICGTSRRPQRALAIGAALTIVGTLAGRHVAGPTGSGTHLYVVGLAPTGAGKDHALQQVLAAMAAADCSHLIGPGQFISMPAVINFLCRAPLSVCAMDEFGSFLKRINSRRASGFEGAISGVLRTAWGSSFKPMPTPEWAGRAAQVIFAPALSIYGVSTAEEFYGALEGGDTSNGVLNRLLVVETRKRPKDRTPRLADATFPPALVDALKAIPNRAGPLVFGQLQMPDHPPPVHRVPWGPGAQDAFSAVVEEINDLCDGDVMAQAFYARVAETTVRLATILAIGCDPARPVVTLEIIQWARSFAMWCAKNLQRGGTEHIADSENQSTANAVRRAIREAGGRMKHRDLLRRINHRVKNRDLHEVIRSLAEAEHVRVEKVVPEKGGPPTLWYSLI